MYLRGQRIFCGDGLLTVQQSIFFRPPVHHSSVVYTNVTHHEKRTVTYSCMMRNLFPEGSCRWRLRPEDTWRLGSPAGYHATCNPADSPAAYSSTAGSD